ncbi:lanthionine synthetase C family protein [Streptomonospora salina]|uniref:Lanthionine synthetase n=1 Tax=Streptomonospora salina TaxID=104205 RepID=A0A841E4G7_9ACTN|nr:lanthionine synthetase C family protein [Streptomonospora salina]MBB5998747.1 hypothetical protein [Streptomonospora salina]
MPSRAAAVSRQLAETLDTPPPADSGGDRGPTSPRWHAQSLSKGAAGVAVLHGLRAQAGLTSADRVHDWLVAASREPVAAAGGAGLWYGAPALAFSLSHAAPERYPRHQTRLHRAVEQLLASRLEGARARLHSGLPPSSSEFDLVRGATGVGAYLLHRAPQSPELRAVLRYLVRLTAPLPAPESAEVALPGWWIRESLSGHRANGVEDGHADLGMAHGVTGPLALLSHTMRAGVTVHGQAEAIDTIAAWLERWRRTGPAGPWWPEHLTFGELQTDVVDQAGPRRPSWCYGTPGIARALQLAGLALGDRVRQEQAETAFHRCLSDPAQRAQLVDPAVCHGWAGVLATTWHAAADARFAPLADHLPRLQDTLLHEATHGAAPLGPGLIEGRAGIAATLHCLTTGAGGWETCLLIAGEGPSHA